MSLLIVVPGLGELEDHRARGGDVAQEGWLAMYGTDQVEAPFAVLHAEAGCRAHRAEVEVESVAVERGPLEMMGTGQPGADLLDNVVWPCVDRHGRS